MSPEGELHIAVRLDGGRVAGVRIASTRPDVGSTLLQGRRAAEITAAVPQLYAVCGASQGTAAELACAAAQGHVPGADGLRRAGAAVARETLAEAARCVLLQWPQWLGEAPDAGALAAARTAHARRAGPIDLREEEGVAAAAGAAVARATFAMPAEEWLAIDTPAGLQRWAAAGQTAAARFVAQSLGAAAAAPAAGAARALPLLPAQGPAQRLPELAAAVEADASFTLRPLWQGAPAETGPLARLQHDALVAALSQQGLPRAPLRWVARLRELALLACGRGRMGAGVHVLPGGAAIAWVENARGLLLHLARVGTGGRAALYRIVAPTEWNFHPDGALPLALEGASFTGRDAVQARVTELVRSLDPCVGWRLEVESA